MSNEPTISLEVTVAEAQVIINALRELPHRVVADLIPSLYSQAMAQATPKSEEVAPEPEAD